MPGMKGEAPIYMTSENTLDKTFKGDRTWLEKDM